MADKTLTVNGQPFTFNRDKFAGVRTMTVNGETVTVDRTAQVIDSDRKGESRPLLSKVVGGAAAAYSLRDLNDKQGNNKVVRVRRGSDNHEQDFLAKEVSDGTLTKFVNAQVVAPLDIKALTATGRDGAYQIAKAAYSLRSLGTRQATLAATGDTVARADGKFVAQVRRNVNGDVKSFTADEVTDGTLTSFVNESFTSSLPLDVAGSAAAAYGLRNLSSSYSGNVVEVRRSSDDTTQNFTAAEITDGTLLAFVNDILTVTTAVNGTGSFDSYTVTNASTTGFSADNSAGGTGSAGFPYSFGNGDVIVIKYTVTNFSDTSDLSPQVRGVNATSSVVPVTSVGSVIRANGTYTDTLTASADGTHLMYADGGTGSYTISDFEIVSHASNGHVKTWYDQSGNSNNATQATAASQPKIVSAGALVTATNSLPAIDFTSSLTSLITEEFLTGQLNSYFNTYQAEAGDSTQAQVVFRQGGNYRLLNQVETSGKIRTSINDAGNDIVRLDAGGDLATGSPLLQTTLIGARGSNGVTLFVNGANELNGDSTDIEDTDFSAADSGSFFIGSNGSSSSYDFHGKGQEFIFYNSNQSDKRRAIEESIATANGITLGSFSRDGFVKTWYDQSVSDQSDAGNTPNGFHATQADTTKQPRVVINGNLNADGIKFDGVDDLLDIGGTGTAEIAIQRANPLSIYAVAMPSSRSLLGDNSNRDLRFTTTGTSYYLSLQPVGATGFSLSSTDLALYSTNHAGVGTESIVQIHANGVAGTPTGSIHGTSNADTAWNPIEYIGANIGNNYQRYYEKSVKEIIIYKSDQTDNRTAIEANIGEAYSIDLPSGVDAGFDQVDGFVETWYDQSGNGRDATQATAGEQPKIVDGGALVTSSGLASIKFDGTDDILTADSVASVFSGTDKIWSHFSVTEFNNVNNTIAVTLGNSSSTSQFIYSGIWDAQKYRFFVRDDVNNPAMLESEALSANTPYLNHVTTNGAAQAQFVNSNAAGTGSTNTGAITVDRFTLGAFRRVSTANFWNGSISEFILYDTDQSANRPAIEANINNQYDIY